MKNTLIILFALLGTILFGQTNIRSMQRLVYGGDTCDTYFSGDTLFIKSPTQGTLMFNINNIRVKDKLYFGYSGSFADPYGVSVRNLVATGNDSVILGSGYTKVSLKDNDLLLNGRDVVKIQGQLSPYIEIVPTATNNSRWRFYPDGIYRYNGETREDTVSFNGGIISESDPVFSAHLASGITAEDTARWGSVNNPENGEYTSFSVKYSEEVTREETLTEWDSMTFGAVRWFGYMYPTIRMSNDGNTHTIRAQDSTLVFISTDGFHFTTNSGAHTIYMDNGNINLSAGSEYQIDGVSITTGGGSEFDTTNIYRIIDSLTTVLNDTVSFIDYLYTKHQTDSVIIAKLDSALADVSTDTTYLYQVIDSLKTRINLTSNSLLKDFYTDVSTSGTDATDLYSYILQPNTLVTNGDKILCRFVVTASTSTSGVNVYFAGNSTQSHLNLSGTVTIDVTFIRVSPSVLRWNVCTDNPNARYNNVGDITGLDFTNSNIIKLAATATVGSVTAKLGYIEYKQSALIDETDPIVDSAHTYNDSTIYLFASELLNEDSIPVADSFYVTENGVRMGVQTVSITNDTIILETDSTIAYNSNLLVDWMGDNIYDLVGNSMDVFSDTSIVNNVEVNTSFNATYQAIYDSMTTKPDLIYAGYQNEFVDSMVIKGYWDRIPSFFFWAQQYNTDGEALMDWKFREHATIVGSPVHTPHQGFYTDGAGDGINSHFNLTTDGGGIMTQYDASLVVYLVNDIANGDYYDAGASNGTAQFSLTADYGGSAYTRINAGTATSATNTNSSGLFCGTRTSETRQELYRGFTSLAQTTSNTASIPNFDVYFLCRNVSGTASDRSPNTQFLGFIADGFTDEEWSEIATICERLADHYSVGVH